MTNNQAITLRWIGLLVIVGGFFVYAATHPKNVKPYTDWETMCTKVCKEHGLWVQGWHYDDYYIPRTVECFCKVSDTCVVRNTVVPRNNGTYSYRHTEQVGMCRLPIN